MKRISPSYALLAPKIAGVMTFGVMIEPEPYVRLYDRVRHCTKRRFTRKGYANYIIRAGV